MNISGTCALVAELWTVLGDRGVREEGPRRRHERCQGQDWSTEEAWEPVTAEVADGENSVPGRRGPNS